MSLIIELAEDLKCSSSTEQATTDTVNVIHTIFADAKKLPKRKRIYGAYGIPYKKESDIVSYLLRYNHILHEDEEFLCKHIIISLGKNPYLKHQELSELIWQICQFYNKDFPIIYAINGNSSDYNLHLIVSNTSKNGSSIILTRTDWKAFKKYVKQLWKKCNRYSFCFY